MTALFSFRFVCFSNLPRCANFLLGCFGSFLESCCAVKKSPFLPMTRLSEPPAKRCLIDDFSGRFFASIILYFYPAIPDAQIIADYSLKHTFCGHRWPVGSLVGSHIKFCNSPIDLFVPCMTKAEKHLPPSRLLADLFVALLRQGKRGTSVWSIPPLLFWYLKSPSFLSTPTSLANLQTKFSGERKSARFAPTLSSPLFRVLFRKSKDVFPRSPLPH